MGSTLSSESATQDHEHYRALARKSAVKRQEFIQQSQIAYRLGDGAKAKAKEYEREMIQYNNKAKDIVFKVNNASRAPNELDLHGLKVKEALEIARDRIELFIRNNEKELIIIVGQGRNSLNGVAKIKPAITEMMSEFKVKATPNKPNAGCILVERLHSGEGIDFSWIDSFFRHAVQKLFRSIFG
ncbi:DUF1771-domain-containing protein [Lobosporangium transversale]|uniref:DUF1771-domain-containing protein n=1 Tax=Lobosporangium transversale TaxID=64571 RepID=A0A1Y2GUS1_9FUNG|nr:DUF1771-domain-containing protein [Lobosporangium transversale]ORZ24801.1 DUF1771-domain-containing protein [Lobosporangium transversale]|eukprot:XP_021883782.1 DUF1771-domain-containing protein [Lobosporangium transversale]